MNQLKLLRAYTLLCLIISFSCYSQLPPDFSFSAAPTAQTCLGNGALTFTVSGTNPAATLAYEVYLLPDTTNPVTTVNTNTVGGLLAGDYFIVATQSLGGQSNTQTATATIDNNITPLSFTIGAQNVRCGNDGVITVNVTGGTAATYEIIAGPVTVPPQTSNVLSGLPVGTYQIRIMDECGEGNVTTYQLIQLNTGITILAGVPNIDVLPSCNQVVVSNDFYCSSTQDIFYPITLTYTVYPPGGGTPTILTQTITNGLDYGTAVQTIPLYYGQSYNYSLSITDTCGNTFTRNNNPVNVQFTVSASTAVENCADNLFTLMPHAFVGPVTVNFTSAPPGFDPATFNASYPTFNSEEIPFGETGNYVPEGEYSVTVTDACGHVASTTFNVEPPQVTPQTETQVIGCTGTGSITIAIPNREIVSISLTGAPAEYTGPNPDVSSFIQGDGSFLIEGVPVGDYSFTMTDSCGEEHEADASLFPPGQILSVQQRPGCEEGFGSIAVTGSSLPITAVNITAGPDTFTTPVNVSQNISGSNFYMNTLPEGPYTFAFTDECGGVTEQNIIVQGYHPTANELNLIPHCGSFDLYLHMAGNSYLNTYWLQEYNEATGLWTHPATGAPYAEGAQPNSNTALLLTNNTTNINLAFTGQFRILKVSFTYSNGSALALLCLNVVDEFTFDGGPVITDAYTFPCSNGLTEVAIIATGVPPLSYSITLKDGQPFTVNNGNSNLFSGLEPASYNFQVTDDCGNIRNRQFDINELSPIEIGAEGFCEGEDSSLFLPAFSFLSYEWYKEGAPGTILSTTSVLDFPSFTSATDSGTYYVNIISGDTDSCLNQTLEYTIEPNDLPNAGGDNTVSLCNGGSTVNLNSYLNNGFETGGTWQDTDNTMALSGSTFAPAGIAAGTYHFTYTVTGDCSLTDEAVITITLKDIPAAPSPDMVSPVCEGDNVQLSVATVPGATYSWIGPGGYTSSQQNPLITNAQVSMSGSYFVSVTLNGCTSNAVPVQVVVESVPNAGADNTASFCNIGADIDLNDYLSADADTNGTWQDTDNTAALNGSNFSTLGMAEGTYTFTYTATGCGITDEAVVTVTLKDLPVAQAPAQLGPFCEGSDIQLTVEDVPGATYSWTGPGGYTSSQQNPLITNAQLAMNGDYFVTVTLNGCSGNAVATQVIVEALPHAGADNTATICNAGGVVNLNDYLESGTDTSGTWQDTDNTTALNGNNFTIDNIAAGTYNFTYTVSGCGQTDDAVIAVTLNDIPTAPQADMVSPVCQGEDVQLSVASVAGASYSWTGPNGFTSTGQNPVIINAQPEMSGNYLVTVSVNGCVSDAATVPVTINALPQFTVQGNTFLCAGQSSILTVEAVNFTESAATYTWYHDGADLNIASSAIEVFDTGTYSVTVVSNGCTTTNQVTVTENTNPFTVIPDGGCVDEEYMLWVGNNNEISGVLFEWTGPGGYNYVGEMANISGQEPGEYFVSVTNADGCTQAGSIMVESTYCKIPRGISPNGDDMNDSFDLTNLDVREIQIFNRYGLEVYHEKNYKNEWHGQSYRGDLPTATYFYLLKLGNGKQVSGWVYLLKQL